MNVAQKISDTIDFVGLGFKEDADLFCAGRQWSIARSESGYPICLLRRMSLFHPKHLLYLFFLICSAIKGNHLEFPDRVDPRLKVVCCPSLKSGTERLTFLQAVCDDWARLDVGGLSDLVGHCWTDQIVFAAEEGQASILIAWSGSYKGWLKIITQLLP